MPTPKRYRKKPIIVTAILWDGKNVDEIRRFCGDEVKVSSSNEPSIKTKEGSMRASVGDMIIRGNHGEFYPCKPDIFRDTFEAV
jgi:hypothetical protein